MKIIIVTISILIAFYPSEQEWSIEGEKYFWEDNNNDFILSPKKSIIEFQHDSIIIVDLPNDPGGMLNFHSGVYNLNKETNTIEIGITRSVRFSLNIGQVVSYTKDCETEFIMQYSESGTIIRKKLIDTFKIKSKSNWRNTGMFEMNYKLMDDIDNQMSNSWTYELKNYDVLGKLKQCE